MASHRRIDDRTLQVVSDDVSPMKLSSQVGDESSLLCDHCKEETFGHSSFLRRRAVPVALFALSLACAALVGIVVARRSALAEESPARSDGHAADRTVVLPPANNTSTNTTFLPRAQDVVITVPDEPTPEPSRRNLTYNLSQVCSANASVGEVAPREKWIVSEGQQRECFKGVIQRYKWNYETELANQTESNGRNWCWVGFKEFGCHVSLYEVKRAHLTWEEMSYKAVPASPQPDPVDPYRPLLDHDKCDRKELGVVRVWSPEEWHAAWVWFAKYVTVYAINLKTNVERWQAFRHRMDELDIKPRRVWGVDMRKEDALQKAKDEGLIPEGYNYTDAQAQADKTYQAMGGILGTVGCASAHFRAQSTAYSESPTPIALVFEDDADPAQDFVPKLWNLVHNEMPCDWQVVSLRSMCPYGRCVAPHLTRVQPDVNEPADRCRHGVNYGMQGVLYRVEEIPKIQNRWKSVVFNESRPHCLDVDVALASISDTVGFYAVPFVQYPGFLTERRGFSSRFTINEGDSA